MKRGTITCHFIRYACSNVKLLSGLMSLDFIAGGRARNWCKQHESMVPSSFISKAQADGGVMVWAHVVPFNTN